VMEAACQEARPDLIFHLAAQTSVPASLRDMVRDAEVNVIGSVNVLRAANQHRARIIFASTGGAMYGNVSEPATESASVRSIAPYAVSKYSAEAYLAAANRYKPDKRDGHVMLRLANVYGPRQDPFGEGGVVAIFLRQLIHRDGTPIIYGSGAQERDFLYVTDAVRALLAVAEQECRGVFNVGTATTTSIEALLRRCCDVVGVPWPDPDHERARRGDLLRSVLDSRKLRQAVGWQPHVGLEAGLVQTADWIRQHAVEAA
jgi:UDP-glucose 4-epimerase